LKEALGKGSQKKIESQPILFNLTYEMDRESLGGLLDDRKVQFIVDDYREQQLELFAVNNPHLVYTPAFRDLFSNYYIELEKKAIYEHGRWVYFPWLSKVVHILDEKEFQKVRTARNKNLINQQEQDRFYNSIVGIAGLSVGSSVAYAIALQGGAKHFKLADMDRLA